MGDEAKPKRILIVDDDDDFVRATAALLEAHGYAVTRATSGQECLAQLAVEPPDLIILDIMMEHADAGYEVNQAIKFSGDYEAARDVPIIMVSSIRCDPCTLFCRSAELEMVRPNCYLTKPLDVPSFLSRVEALLGKAKEP
jgi:CheY-like chemotaxis protein